MISKSEESLLERRDANISRFRVIETVGKQSNNLTEVLMKRVSQYFQQRKDDKEANLKESKK